MLQVHEKSILLPLLPVTLLWFEEPRLANWLPLVAAFSMYPLLQRDGLMLAYMGMIAMFAAFVLPDICSLRHRSFSSERMVRRKDNGEASSDSSSMEQAQVADVLEIVWDVVPWPSVIVALFIHVCAAAFDAPAKYPYIKDAVMVIFAFMHFLPAFVTLTVKQMM